MSAESLKAFFAKVHSDPALTAKAKEIGTSDFKKTEAFAKELGFDITDEDLTEYVKETQALSDDDLDNVAGGIVTSLAVAAVAASAAVVSAGTGVTSTTQGGGW